MKVEMKPKLHVSIMPWRALAIAVAVISPYSLASDPFKFDESLLPVARAFIGLSLCADFAESHGKSDRATEYQAASAQLLEAVKSSIWDREAMPSAMVVAFDELSTLQRAPGFSPHTYYSRRRCETYTFDAQKLISEGIPEPASPRDIKEP